MKRSFKTIVATAATTAVLAGMSSVFAATPFAVSIVETKNADGSVTMTATSSNGFAKTKPTWTLSANSKTYTKTFGVNQKYDTVFTDVNNNTVTKTINVTKVSAPEINIGYTAVDSETKTVKMTATLINDDGTRKFSATKPTWTLSDDKRTYTKTVPATTADYETTFVDEYGNKEVVKLTPVGFDIDLSYNYSTPNCVDVTATLLGGNPTEAGLNKIMKVSTEYWGLTSDGATTITKRFASAGKENVTFTDKNGNTVTKTINIPSVPTVGFTLTAAKDAVQPTDGSVKYKVTLTTPATGYKLKDVKPTWTMAADGLSETKVFTENQTYVTNFTVYKDDATKAETVIPVKINITDVDKKAYAETIKFTENFVNGESTLVATSAAGFKETKPTWKLTSPTTYEKTFTSNQNYKTTFTSPNGMIAEKDIVVEKVNNFDVEVEVYKTSVIPANKLTGAVKEDKDTTIILVAKAKDGRKLASTVKDWTLDSSRSTYTKEIELKEDQAASKVTFKDDVGNTCEVSIPKLEVKKYEDFDVSLVTSNVYTADPATKKITKTGVKVVASLDTTKTTDGDTLSVATADIPKDWSVNGSDIERIFTSNINTTVTFTSAKGNTVSKNIEINESDFGAKELEVTYDTTAAFADGDTFIDVIITATTGEFKADSLPADDAGKVTWTLVDATHLKARITNTKVPEGTTTPVTITGDVTTTKASAVGTALTISIDVTNPTDAT